MLSAGSPICFNLVDIENQSREDGGLISEIGFRHSGTSAYAKRWPVIHQAPGNYEAIGINICNKPTAWAFKMLTTFEPDRSRFRFSTCLAARLDNSVLNSTSALLRQTTGILISPRPKLRTGSGGSLVTGRVVVFGFEEPYDSLMQEALENLFFTAGQISGTKPERYPQPAAMVERLSSTETPELILKVTAIAPKNGFTSLLLTSSNIHAFTKKAPIFGGKESSYEVLALSSLTGITTQRFNKLVWSIEFSRANNVDRYAGLEGEVKTFASKASTMMAEMSSQLGGGVSLDPMDQLKKLKELLELGAISQDEFDEGKKSLLGKI